MRLVSFAKKFKSLFFAKLNNIKIGKNTSIHKMAELDIEYGGQIIIGNNCYIGKYSILSTFGGVISIGNDCSVNPFCLLYGHGGLTIGNKVRIATHTVIIPANHTYEDSSIPIMDQPETRVGVIIEDDVWIGSGVRILDGVKIGKGSAIGAGSVVTRSIPPYSVAVGIPAKVIKSRKQ